MKRSVGFAFLIFVILNICALMQVSADNGVYTHHIRINDYTTETYNVTLSLPDGKTAPEGGLQLALYFGTGAGKSTGSSGGEKIKYLGCHGADLKDVPPDSDVYKTNGINISKRRICNYRRGAEQSGSPDGYNGQEQVRKLGRIKKNNVYRLVYVRRLYGRCEGIFIPR